MTKQQQQQPQQTTRNSSAHALSPSSSFRPPVRRLSFQKDLLGASASSKAKKLYGRVTEQAQLQAAYARVVASQQQELILISGPPGTGKTALAHSTFGSNGSGSNDGSSSSSFFFVSGKFDQEPDRAEPYKVFVSALTEYLQQLLVAFDTAQVRHVVQQAIFGSSTTDTTDGQQQQQQQQQQHAVLTDVVPALQKLVTVNNNNNKKQQQQQQPYSSSYCSYSNQHCFRFAFCQLIRALTTQLPSNNHTLVLFLDDLQWADTASLELLRVLLNDKDNNDNDNTNNSNSSNDNNNNNNNNTATGMRCLVLGAHRCDMLDDEQPQRQQQQQPQQQQPCLACQQMKPFKATLKDLENDKVPIQMMDLKDLELDDIETMLADLLLFRQQEPDIDNDNDNQLAEEEQSSQSQSLKELAKLVYAQTHGNMFHVMQFLRLLIDQGFLTTREESLEFIGCNDDDESNSNNNDTTTTNKNNNNYASHCRWRWDMEAIQRLGSTETYILELVQQSLLQLPRLAQHALQVASVMGRVEIDDSALDLVLQTKCSSRYLEQAASEGLLVFLPQYGGYRFAHDWIRQAAYALIPPDERDEFHLKVGRKLWKSSRSSAAVDKNIFLVVSLLNKGTKLMKEERERYKVAALNLKAGERAVSFSSYPDASRFLRKGILLLGTNRWNDYYELTLALYSTAAEVDVINGNYERVVLQIEEIVKNGRCLEDKLRAYVALIRAMGQQDNLMESTVVGIDVLKQLGEVLPPKPTKFAIGKELTKTKMALRRRKTLDDILGLPAMRDPCKIACMQILTTMFWNCYAARSPYTAVLASRSVLLTLRYGLHEYSAIAFAAYGLTLCGSGIDVRSGHFYGQVAVSIAEKLQAKDVIPTVFFFNGAGIGHWTMPIKETFDGLRYASRAAMEIGDVETAIMAKLVAVVSSMFTGSPIPAIEKEVDECIRMARLYRKHSNQVAALMALQLIHCYTGRGKHPSRLCGDVINFDGVMKECVEARNSTWVAALYFYGLELAYLFGDYDLADVMADGNRDLQKTPSALFAVVGVRYKQGLTAVAMARNEVHTRKNIKRAKEMLKKMTVWARDSPRSYLHKQLLLEAELSTLNPKTKQTKTLALYKEAAADAMKEGYINQAALIFERTGDYLTACGDHKAASVKWDRAIELYLEWGAIAKAEQLRQKESITCSKDSIDSDTGVFSAS